MTDIALFPIPNCVAFPGVPFPLHVFEPRYRKMVNHCIDTGMLMGVCNTQKVLHEAKPDQTIDEALHSNQATYKPCEIFSAGKCELLEVFKDGRMAIQVEIEQRFKLGNVLQTLPFSIYSCSEYDDDELTENQSAALYEMKEKILVRLSAITHHIPELQSLLHSNEWQKMPPETFSFKIFSLFQIPGDHLQTMLEYRNPKDRLSSLLMQLNHAAV